MKHSGLRFFFLFLIFLILGSVQPAKADMGPKPSVTIHFNGLEGKGRVYGTLLSQRESTGPYSAPSREAIESRKGDASQNIWLKFAQYEDPDHFYFLNFLQEITADQPLHWGYYPPDNFKLLLYFEEQDTFLSSGVHTRYAFKSQYDLSLQGDIMNLKESEASLVLNKTRGVFHFILAYGLRLLLTLAVELPLAWLFTIRSRRGLVVILLTNAVTQFLLSLLLFLSGGLFIFHFFWIEIGVFVTEAAIYSWLIRKKGESSSLYIIYALTANFLSMLLGIAFWAFFPGLL